MATPPVFVRRCIFLQAVDPKEDLRDLMPTVKEYVPEAHLYELGPELGQLIAIPEDTSLENLTIFKLYDLKSAAPTPLKS